MLDYQSWYILSVPLYCVFLTILIIKKIELKKIFFYSVFFYYIVAVISVTLFPLPFQRTLIQDSKELVHLENNLIPFHSIVDITSHNSIAIVVKQIVGNIILFIPLGFFVPLIWIHKQNLKNISIGFLAAIGIEATQYTISLILGFTYKIADIDDVLLNTIGYTIGYLIFKVYYYGFDGTKTGEER